MVIYDLPPEVRYKFKNISIVGLYFGSEKPNMNEYLKNIVTQLLQSQNGEMYVNGEARNISLLTFSADLPAKAIVLNSLQYNGSYGCHTCLEEGVYMEHRRVWPFKDCSNWVTIFKKYCHPITTIPEW
eukprot:Pompholyxophrys_sp_v1_NODE_233_length_1021_cov_17.448240.p2 type:complete len:128 gc:universal NODE_233_length_1021_cov_17.448240:632-1015(+)